MKAYKLLAIALLATANTLPAQAKFDDGVGKSGGQVAVAGTSCDRELKTTGIKGAKYEQRMHDCTHNGNGTEKVKGVSARQQMLEGNHKLQWQQGYTQ